MPNRAVAAIEKGIEAYEDAARCHVTDWHLDSTHNTLTIELLPLPPEEVITVQDVLDGIEESEAWFADNPD